MSPNVLIITICSQHCTADFSFVSINPLRSILLLWIPRVWFKTIFQKISNLQSSRASTI